MAQYQYCLPRQSALPLTHAGILIRVVVLKQQPLWENGTHLLALAAIFAAILAGLSWAGSRLGRFD